MKKFWKIPAFAIVAVLAFACSNPKDGESVLFPPVSPEPILSDSIQAGVVKYPNPVIDWTRKFPGLVPDSVKRYVKDNLYSVTIDMNYKVSSTNIIQSYYGSGTRPIFSTGVYAPPAELVTVYREPGTPNVIVRINMNDNLNTLVSKGEYLQRQPIINTSVQFATGVDSVQIWNYSGGILTITPPDAAGTSGVQTYKFKGVVKSATFFLGTTSVDDWFDELHWTQVPLLEVVGRRMIWTLPMTSVNAALASGNLTRENFPKLIALYDDMMLNDYFAFNGLSLDAVDPLDRAPDFKIRNLDDIQISAGAAHSGYPAMYGHSFGIRGLQYPMMINGNAWGLFHEIGHNFQMSSWVWGSSDYQVESGEVTEDKSEVGIGEVSNNVHIFHYHNRANGTWLDPVSTSRFQNAARNFAAVDDPLKNFGLADDGSSVLSEIINSDKARITPFLQIAQKIGWGFYAYLGYTSRRLSSTELSNVKSAALKKKSFFVARACEYAQTDLTPFFDGWGITYTPSIKTAIQAAGLQQLDPADKFWADFDNEVIPTMDMKDPSTLTIKIPNSAI